jgi:hypothetical protein
MIRERNVKTGSAHADPAAYDRDPMAVVGRPTYNEGGPVEVAGGREEGTKMRRMTAVVLASLLIVLGMSATGAAQSVIQVQGTIQSVNCQTSTLFLRGPNGVVNTLPGTAYTAVFVNGVPVPFCALQQYVGGYAVATVTATANQLVAGRIDVVLAAAPAPAPYYYPYPYGYYPYGYYPWGYYGPPVGIGIGIVIGPGGRHYYHRRAVPIGAPWYHGAYGRSRGRAGRH